LKKKILGKHYPFGYEKSFKHKEVRVAFKNARLSDIEVFAYNPFNYIVRFFFFNQTLKKIIAGPAIFVESLLDLVTFKKFSRAVGYMLFGKGRK